MKILLDENIPVDLKKEFTETTIEVFSVREMKWDGIKNGKLLEIMVKNQFDALITIDKNLEKQQNISKYKLSLFVLDSVNNKIQTLIPFINKLKIVMKSKHSQGIIKIKL